jgi:hypothetical protein
MARARSHQPDTVASLKRKLAEKDALLAEQEALLIERERAIAVRDAELYAKTCRSSTSRRSLRCFAGRGSAAHRRSLTVRSSSLNSCSANSKRA